ncbi:MAG: hypothetical protein GX774_20710 [Armatimonadetes bacterium]|nr:hypothetical protein [Armatimonadota bacterium]
MKQRQDTGVAGRWAQRGLFGFCLAVFLLTYNTRLGSIDAVILFDTAAALYERGTFAIENPRATRGVDGRYYSKYGPLQSLVAVPLYAAGKLAARVLPVPERHLTRAAVALLNPVVTAWLAALLFGVGCRLGLSPRRAAAAALLYAFATIAWYYSKTFFSEPLTALLIVAGFARALSYRATGAARHLWVAGACAALAVATRPVALLAVPVLALGALGGSGRRPRAVAGLLVPLVVVGALLALYNYLRFGSPLDTGYHGESFSTPPWVGLAGLLVSPRCGLLFYAPILVLAPWGYRTLARRQPHAARAIALLGVLWLLAMSAWSCWWAGGSWGPRLLLPLFPFLAILTAAALPSPRSRRWPLLAGVVVLVAASVAVQGASVLVTNARWEYGVDLLAQAEGGNSLWSFRYMPLRWQASYAREVLDPARPYRVTEATLLPGEEEDAPPRALDPLRARERSENRLDGHVVDAWYALFALMGLPLVPLLAGVLLLLAVAGASLVVLISAVDRMAGEQLTDGP